MPGFLSLACSWLYVRAGPLLPAILGLESHSATSRHPASAWPVLPTLPVHLSFSAGLSCRVPSGILTVNLPVYLSFSNRYFFCQYSDKVKLGAKLFYVDLCCHDNTRACSVNKIHCTNIFITHLPKICKHKTDLFIPICIQHIRTARVSVQKGSLPHHEHFKTGIWHVWEWPLVCHEPRMLETAKGTSTCIQFHNTAA